MNEFADREKNCVATVTTDSFIVGTLVTLNSFLKNNSWFAGEIVIICHELSEQNREYLRLLYDKVIFLKVSNEILTRIEEVTKVFPNLSAKQARYYSLETFLLRNYKRVLFLDSDLLFLGSVEDLFELQSEFIACGDGAFYNNRGRRWGRGIEDEAEISVLRNTFNAGLFLIDESLLTDKIYSELIELVDSRIYKTPDMMLTDQVILNLYFANRQHLASGRYNYLLAHKDAIIKYEKINLEDAVVVHFNGQPKPWMTKEMLTGDLNNEVFFKAAGWWFESYLECLQKLHWQTSAKNLQSEKI